MENTMADVTTKDQEFINNIKNKLAEVTAKDQQIIDIVKDNHMNELIAAMFSGFLGEGSRPMNSAHDEIYKKIPDCEFWHVNEGFFQGLEARGIEYLKPTFQRISVAKQARMNVASPGIHVPEDLHYLNHLEDAITSNNY